MASTSTKKCPFKYDDVAGAGLACETVACAGWNAESGECLLIQAALLLLQKEHVIKTLDRGDVGV